MQTRLRVGLVSLIVGLANSARADTLQASSTTMLIGRQDFRVGAVQTAVPIFEIVDVSASDVRTPYTDDLEIGVSTWGALDAANGVRFWQNGALATDRRLSGDVNTAFVRADFLNKALSLRVGRQLIPDGVARMIQIDGGQLRLVLPAGFGLSGFAGSPVQPRFEARGGPFTVGNTTATFVTGGRASWRYPGLLDVGASAAFATDRGDPSRQDVGGDFRLTPHRVLAFVGSGWWSVYEQRIGEASIAGVLTPSPLVDLTLDYRHYEPDLFLPRNSILSVFASDKRNALGGSVHSAGALGVALDAEYHLLLQDAGTGHWARLKASRPLGSPATTAGAEMSYLKSPDNGYTMARLFGAKTLEALTGTLDLYGYFFEKAVNGEHQALTATATLGYEFARGWRALLAGTGGTTAFLSSQFDVMAKLVYNQTYATREVR